LGCGLFVLAGLGHVWARAEEERAPVIQPAHSAEPGVWQRVESLYCTILVDPSVELKQINQKLKTWRMRPQVGMSSTETPEAQLASKCDSVFRRTQDVLDMYPNGLHVTVKITPTRDSIQVAHAARYGVGTEAIAFYVFENNTIYATAKALSTSVLAHEMAHCIIDYYFGIRPPRKIEEMLAMYVDAHFGEGGIDPWMLKSGMAPTVRTR